MKNQLLIIISIIMILFVLSGCNEQREDDEILYNDGIIYVAQPSKSNDYYRPFYNDISTFHKQFKKNKSTDDTVRSLTFQETGYDDIWIRDVAPVATNRLVKFVYSPNYIPEEDSHILDRSFRGWMTDNNFEVHYSSLVLDGGNLIWNNKDTVILTTRILDDNPELKREEIITQLKSDLNVKRVILLPPEQGDILAHADGMVKFINENTLFISDFMGDDKFRQRIEDVILDEMPDAEFILMPSAYTEEGQYDDEISSAKGLYINILETDSTLYVPQFGLPEDEAMIDFIAKYTDKQVIPLEIESLSTMGGALNCLTWYCPVDFLPTASAIEK